MKAETKFEITAKVWALVDNKAKLAPISEIEIRVRSNKTSINYFLNVGTEERFDCKIVSEENCFASREELINSL